MITRQIQIQANSCATCATTDIFSLWICCAETSGKLVYLQLPTTPFLWTRIRELGFENNICLHILHMLCQRTGINFEGSSYLGETRQNLDLMCSQPLRQIYWATKLPWRWQSPKYKSAHTSDRHRNSFLLQKIICANNIKVTDDWFFSFDGHAIWDKVSFSLQFSLSEGGTRRRCSAREYPWAVQRRAISIYLAAALTLK